MPNAVILDEQDDVVVAIQPIFQGEEIYYCICGQEYRFQAAADVTIYHKIARCHIPKGGTVSKYGQPIGVATCEIQIGEHVHTHNIESQQESLQDRWRRKSQ